MPRPSLASVYICQAFTGKYLFNFFSMLKFLPKSLFTTPIMLYLALLVTVSTSQNSDSPPQYEHARWGLPEADIVRTFEAYTVSFDSADDDTGDGRPDYFRIPEWVAYEIKRFEGRVPSHRRPKWFTDEALFAQGIAPDDDSYRGQATQWNRGHLCMKNHAARIGASADRDTHSLLNAAPQSALLNQGIWLDLEEKTGDWADRYGRVWIICGPILEDGRPQQWIGEGDELRVAVPTAFFKIVVRESGDPKRPEVLAFIYPNSESTKELAPKRGPFDHQRFTVSVDAIESRTGLDFLTLLNDSIEAEIERVVERSIWR